MSSRFFRVFLFIAGFCLVLNDVARVAMPCVRQILIDQINDISEQDDNNSLNSFSFFEEEVKHQGKERPFFLAPLESELEVSASHLIQDDDVRHLAYIPIYTPPPDRA